MEFNGKNQRKNVEKSGGKIREKWLGITAKNGHDKFGDC